jgi:hypothetical protein
MLELVKEPVNNFLLCIKQEMNLEAPPALGGGCAAPMLGDSMAKAPSSPWMPFSMLFAAISTKVSPQIMDMVIGCYEEFKVCYNFFSSLLAEVTFPSMVSRITCICMIVCSPE